MFLFATMVAATLAVGVPPSNPGASPPDAMVAPEHVQAPRDDVPTAQSEVDTQQVLASDVNPLHEVPGAFAGGFVLGGVMGLVCGGEGGDWCAWGTPWDGARVGLRIGAFAAIGAALNAVIVSGGRGRHGRDQNIRVTVAPVPAGVAGQLSVRWR